MRLRSLADFPEIPDIPEVGATFADNAAAKAKAVAQRTGLPALANDSASRSRPLIGGRMCIRPGTPRTAPAAVPAGPDNWQKLSMNLRMFRTGKGRRFVCAIALAFPDRRLVTTRELGGLIAREARGAGELAMTRVCRAGL